MNINNQFFLKSNQSKSYSINLSEKDSLDNLDFNIY
jgi:hypothetical protein